MSGDEWVDHDALLHSLLPQGEYADLLASSKMQTIRAATRSMRAARASQRIRRKSVRSGVQVELAELRASLATVRREVAELREALQSPPLMIDPAIDWLNRHAREVRAYSGQYIAVHPERGIVAAAPTLEEVTDRAERLGLLSEIVLSSVPEN